MGTRYVFFREDGSEFHENGCPCDLCNGDGKSWGVTLYDVTPLMPLYQQEWELLQDWIVQSEGIHRVYGPSEEAALDEMERVCKQEGWEIVSGMTLPAASCEDVVRMWGEYANLPKKNGKSKIDWRIWPGGSSCEDIARWLSELV